MQRSQAQAMRDGRDAAMIGSTANPHRTGTKRHNYRQWGHERTMRLLAQIQEIGR